MANFKAFILVSTSALLFHLATNTISEYRDCVTGIDDPNSPGTKYRLITGIVPQKNILYLGLISFIVASICGIIAVFISSPVLILPGIIAAGFALFYSEKPFGFKYKGLGEISVFLCYGLLLGFSTIYSITGKCSIIDILVFIPGSLLITCVLLANNIRDYSFDKKCTVTLVTVIGIKKSYKLLYALANASYILYIILILYRILPQTAYIILLSYPVLFLSLKYKKHPKFINFFGALFFLTELITIASVFNNNFQ